MRLDRSVTLSLVHPLIRIGALRARPAVPVLMYHSISDSDESAISPYYRVVTSPQLFREQMVWLRQSGYRTVSLQEAFTGADAAAPCRAVITFDDGFKDFQTHAWPVLEEFGMTATVFLPTNCIDGPRPAFKGRECLTWADVRQLHADGVCFGSHTASHPTLYHLQWDVIRRELAESKSRLEDELQAPVDTFAYPFAFPQEDPAFVKRFVELLAEERYRFAVTTMIGRASVTSSPLCIPRLPVNECDDHALFTAKLEGAYDWLSNPQKMQRQLASRMGGGRHRQHDGVLAD